MKTMWLVRRINDEEQTELHSTSLLPPSTAEGHELDGLSPCVLLQPSLVPPGSPRPEACDLHVCGREGLLIPGRT